MGYYRLLLAVCVLVSHAYPRVYGWNIGAVAVMSFLVISGFTNALLIDRHYPEPRQIGWFYLDKIVRLFPLYWFYLAVTVLLNAALGLEIVENPSPELLLLNAALLPVGYADFGFIDSRYIPAAWTLGLELTFYIVLPFLLLVPRLAAVATLASIGVAALAFAGVIKANVYGYHLLPGLLFVFMAGAAMVSPRAWRGAIPAALLYGAIFTTIAVTFPGSAHGITREVAAGIFIGVIGVLLTRRLPWTRMDVLVGNLTYGVYLNHQVLIAVLDHFRVDRIWTLPISLLLAAITYVLIERPVIEWRRGLRRGKPEPGATPGAVEGPAS